MTYTNQIYTNTITDANPANDPIVRVTEPTLTLTKTVPTTPFDAGDLVTYTLNIANNSQQMAYDLSVTDALPAMLSGGTVLSGVNFLASGFYASTVRAASTNDIGATFSAGSFSSAPATVDGITLNDNDRVLVKNQALPSQNGIYTVTSASGGTWTRATDFASAAQITNGYLVSVLGGIWNTNSLYSQTNTISTVNTDSINWIYFGTNTLPQATNFTVVGGVVQIGGNASVNLPPGASISLKVAGNMAANYQAGQVITNTATIQWTSTPGANSDERNGSGSPAYNNYAATNIAITAAATPVLSKAIVATDESGVVGNSGLIGTNATIGEIITYRVTISLPEGATTNLVVTDNLPIGLAYVTNSLSYLTNHPVDANANHPGTGTSNFNGTLPSLPAVTPASPTNGAIQFTFGNITVVGDNDTNNNTFAFTYKAIVLDITTNSGYTGTQRFWTNGITWTAGLTNGTGLVDPAGNIVAVVEPRLLLSQTIAVNGTPGNTNGDLGNSVTLTLNVAGAANSLSTAYNTTFADNLPTQIGHSTYASLTMADVIITNTAGTDISSYFTLVGGVLQTTNGTALSVATNGGFTVVITGVLNATAIPGQLYTNTATLGWSTRNGDCTTAGGFDVNPYLNTDHERIYGLTNSTVLDVNIDSIAGYVYGDANNDGIKQSGETGLNGVNVTLTGTDAIGRTVNLATNTSANGSYFFGSLVPGNYVLARTTTPGGYLDGKETVGTLFGGSVNNTNTIDSTNINAIIITAGNNNNGTNYNFGLIQPNSLAGTVFADLNRDGVKNGAEYVITNVTVTLTGVDDRGNAVSNVLQTLTDGSYAFTSLRPSTNYTITETQPAGYGQGTNAVGSTGGTNSAQDVLSGIALTQNQNGMAYNFGETAASFGNYVWNDVNADGVKQAAERGIGSVLVYIDANHDGIYETNETSVLTDTNGYYIFTNLLSGAYTVRVSTNTLPVGASETYDLDGTNSQNAVTNIVILPGTNRVDVNFGYRYVTPTLAVLQAGSFRGIATKDGVELNWNTISEVGTADFIINSKNPDGQWEPISFTLALDSITGGTYTSWDANATIPGTYEYQLIEEQMSGADIVLANCTVVVGNPIYLTIRLINSYADVQWSGGVPPYRLFVSTNLNNSSSKSNSINANSITGFGVINTSAWTEVPLSSSSTNEAVLPTTTDSSFYRVTGGK